MEPLPKNEVGTGGRGEERRRKKLICNSDKYYNDKNNETTRGGLSKKVLNIKKLNKSPFIMLKGWSAHNTFERRRKILPQWSLHTFSLVMLINILIIMKCGVLHVECSSPSSSSLSSTSISKPSHNHYTRSSNINNNKDNHNSNTHTNTHTTNTNNNKNDKTNNHHGDSATSATTLSSSSVSSPSSSSATSSSSASASVSHPVVAGAAMHLFPRYGYLSLSMRVVPRNDTQNWIFLEPSKDVFVPSTTKIQEQSFINSDNSLPLHNEFHIDLCEDIQQLIQAYFRRFIIEGLEKPWHAFAGGWRTPSLAKYFGIDPVYIKGDYRYMLVRVLMVRKAGRLTPLQNVTVTPAFQGHVNSFRVKDYPSSFSFFNEVGTHYINSFLTGNAIYQVFVYDQQGYDAVKRRLSETGWVRSSYMAQLPYLLPLWVKHMGKVMLLNGNPQTTQSVREALTIRFLFSVYPNIFKMHDNSDLVRLIEKYLKSEPDGLLGLELKTLDVVFRDPAKRKWFIESLQQTMHLWEVNLR